MSAQRVNYTGRWNGKSSPSPSDLSIQLLPTGEWKVTMRRIQFTCDVCGAKTTSDTSEIKKWWTALLNGTAFTLRPLRGDDTTGQHLCSFACVDESVKGHVIARAVVEKMQGNEAAGAGKKTTEDISFQARLTDPQKQVMIGFARAQAKQEIEAQERKRIQQIRVKDDPSR